MIVSQDQGSISLSQKPKKSYDRSKKNKKRITVRIHTDIPDKICEAIRSELKSIRSLEIEKTCLTKKNTISVLFLEENMEPMIYYEPKDLDEKFFSTLNKSSIILSSRHKDNEIMVYANYYNVVMMNNTEDNAKVAIRHVLVENNIIGEGFSVKSYGNLFNTVLCEFPLIRSTYAEAISSKYRNVSEFLRFFDGDILTAGGRVVPSSILLSFRKFLETNDHQLGIETSGKKKV